MDELQSRIDLVLSSLGPAASQRESLEWYLRNHLQAYKAAMEGATTRLEAENATRILVRFCTESMDWDSRFFKDCIEATSLGSKVAKTLPIKRER